VRTVRRRLLDLTATLK